VAGRPSLMDINAALRLFEVGDYLAPYAIRAVCLLGIADRLAAGPMAVSDLAATTGTDLRSLRKIVRYLSTRGVFELIDDDRVELTAMGDLLRADHPYSAREVFLSPVACSRAMEGMDHAVRTGQPAFDAVHRRSFWDHLAENPEDGSSFDRVMGGVTSLEFAAAVRATGWARFATVVDVGGGNGSFLARLLTRFRNMRGTVFDRPEVICQAGSVFADAGVADRAAAVGGSFLTGPVPPGADAYVLKRILYSWNDQAAATILGVIRAAMRPDSRLFIMEAGRSESNQGDGRSTAESQAAADGLQSRLDLLMLTLSGGGARSLTEQTELLASAGLSLVGCTHTVMYPVLEAAPVG